MVQMIMGAVLSLLAFMAGGPAGAESASAVEPRSIAQELLDRFPRSPRAVAAAAAIEHRAGALDRAFELYGRALETHGPSVEAREARGDISTRRGRHAEAAEEYLRGQAGASQADLARLHLKRGASLLSLGSLAEAEAETVKAISFDASQADARLQLAQCLLARGEADRARRELEAARRAGGAGPSYDRASARADDRASARAVEYALARACLLAGDRRAAEEALGRFRALRVHPPDQAEALLRREEDREKLERRHLALAHLDAAGVLRQEGLLAESRRRLEAALAADAGLHPARFMLAQVLEELGELELAGREYDRLLAEASDPGPLRKVAAALYRRRVRSLLEDPASARSRIGDALAWSRRALELDPVAEGHETAAWACLAAGDRERGLGHLREAARLEPGNLRYVQKLRALESGSPQSGGPRAEGASAR